MATITIRNLPVRVVSRLKRVAAMHDRSMEQEVRDILLDRFADRRETVKRIRESWKGMPETSAEEVDRWIEHGRSGRDPDGL